MLLSLMTIKAPCSHPTYKDVTNARETLHPNGKEASKLVLSSRLEAFRIVLLRVGMTIWDVVIAALALITGGLILSYADKLVCP